MCCVHEWFCYQTLWGSRVRSQIPQHSSPKCVLGGDKEGVWDRGLCSSASWRKQRVRTASLLEGICFIRDTGLGRQLTVHPWQVGSPPWSQLPCPLPVSHISALTTSLMETKVRSILLCQVELVVQIERVALWEVLNQRSLVCSSIFHSRQPLSICKVLSEPL